MRRLLWLFPLCLLAQPALGQESKPAPKEPPRVVVVSPLGAVPGAVTKLTIRGLKLDTATDVYFPELRLAAPIQKKGKVNVPGQQDAARVGDTELVCEVALPTELTPAPLVFFVGSPDGQSPLHHLLVDLDARIIAKKEPNNGFRQAQPVALGEVVEGVIQQPQEVDVYRFEGQAGQTVAIEVLAARHGSALDSVLTLHDAGGRILASNDDAQGPDSRIAFKLPSAGTYFVVVQDAHDQGGPAFGYRLAIK